MLNEQQANAEAKWELVTDEDAKATFGCVHRLRVPGGWIYRVSMTERGGHNPALSAVFVPEPSRAARAAEDFSLKNETTVCAWDG